MEELFISLGLRIALCAAVFLLFIHFTAFLFAFGGKTGTSLGWRRIGIPVLLSFSVFFSGPEIKDFLLILSSQLLLYASLSIGYGIPTVGDNGSPLGNFWFDILMDEKRANVMTRISAGLCYALSFLPMSVIKVISFGNIFGMVFCVVNTVYWGAIYGDIPPFKIGRIKLNATELNIGGGIGVCWVFSLL